MIPEAAPAGLALAEDSRRGLRRAADMGRGLALGAAVGGAGGAAAVLVVFRLLHVIPDAELGGLPMALMEGAFLSAIFLGAPLGLLVSMLRWLRRRAAP